MSRSDSCSSKSKYQPVTSIIWESDRSGGKLKMETNVALASTLRKTETQQLVDSWVTEAYRQDRKSRHQHTRYAFVRPAAICQRGWDVRVMCVEISKEEVRLLQSEYPPKTGEATVSLWLRSRIVHLDVEVTNVEELENGWWSCSCKPKTSVLESVLLRISTMGSEIER